ncbi:caspase family protein [Mucilaginibacter roseus]|uniref:Caspase family protein n=1 Tax=Mucilaginibacter roseus TaxID=1528868 RepID=A0ABS8U0U5_9SPHI|nr:caspase family protein [Mucilaginibacter roseus]MCD8739683.1 caspase family protein [Mucilaginibacter roseus]
MPGENRYLIIGIDEYPLKRYKRISNAKVDGNRFAKVLQEKYGFTAVREPMYDDEATHDNIADALMDLSQSSFEEDNLIIYFAGHGDQHPTSKKGYWIPVDGENDAKKFIKNSSVFDDLEAIQAKHILLISDSCYSGTFISRTRASGKIMTADELDALPSRWVFVSGGEEPVKDGKPGEGSPFGIALCNYLEENIAPVLTAGEIFNEVIRAVENKGGQQPQADEIRCDAHEGGQMVFRLRTDKSGDDDVPPLEPVRFPLPEAKIEYYIPRLLTYYDHQESKDIQFFQPEVGKIYLNSLIRSHKRIVLLGAAGSGKSVELLSLAHGLQLTNELLNPIFQRFNTYTEENISDYLPENWQQSDPSNLVLFLDGLDEIQPKHFQTAIRKINAFSQQNPLVRMVISCRNNFYELPYENFSGTLDGFSVYTLNDISVPEIIRVVSEKFNLDGDDFITKVHGYSFLDLVQKPFFLNILIKYYKEHNDFSGGRAGIMEEALLKYYINDKQHFVATVAPLSKTLIFKLLEKVAFVMEMVGRNFVTEEELLKIFPNKEEQDRCLYLPAFKKSGENDRWMFEHNNLQEYITSRVLSKKSASEIIKIIAVSTAGELRVKPSWVNTLSFFISIADDDSVQQIFNWIIQHDREVIIKFEPERLSVTQRVGLFKDIFNFYSGRQIWLRSNKFSDKDLARFGESKEILEYLLALIVNSPENRIARLNAVHILSHYHISRFYDYYEQIRAALLGLLETPQLSANDAYVIIGALSELKITNAETIENIVAKYRERRNQYIRAALYKLLITANAVDKYVDIFIEGIDLADLDSPSNDREQVNLFDETLLLKIGIQNIKTANGLTTLIDKLIHSENKRELLMSDYHEILTSLVNSAVNLYPYEKELFSQILNLFLADVMSYHSHTQPKLVDFFDRTDTRWLAFKTIWETTEHEGYVKGVTLTKLLNQNIIDHFIDYIRNAANYNDQIKEFYDFIFWNKRSDDAGFELIEHFEKKILSDFKIILERPVVKDWQQIHRMREQTGFDLWFDDDKMINEIRYVFNEIGKKELSRDEIFNYNHHSDLTLEDRIPNSVHLIFNHLTMRGRIISEEEIVNYIISNEDYQNFRISHIHSDILNKKDLKISPEQIEFIDTWVQVKGNSRKILWDFLNKFNLKVAEEKVLDLTNFTHFNYDVKLTDPGSIEQLEKFVSPVKIKAKVAENLSNPNLDMMAWVNNAGYALRKNLSASYNNILDKLEQTYEFEYKFREILAVWFEKTKNVERLKSLILAVGGSYLRWDAIRLLEDKNTEVEFLNSLFHQIIDSVGETSEEKIQAGNHLMKQNDLYGFNFLADLILSNPDPGFDFRLNLGSISLLRDIAAVPKIMLMLEIAKQPAYKTDVFNDFEDRLLSALHNIGIQSSHNYLFVKTAIQKFIVDHEKNIANVNFLYFSIVQMEEQIKIKQTKNSNIEEAINEYNLLLEI